MSLLSPCPPVSLSASLPPSLYTHIRAHSVQRAAAQQPQHLARRPMRGPGPLPNEGVPGPLSVHTQHTNRARAAHTHTQGPLPLRAHADRVRVACVSGPGSCGCRAGVACRPPPGMTRNRFGRAAAAQVPMQIARRYCRNCTFLDPIAVSLRPPRSASGESVQGAGLWMADSEG
jgi:hypothetical protein